jgi:hypothetical protein
MVVSDLKLKYLEIKQNCIVPVERGEQGDLAVYDYGSTVHIVSRAYQDSFNSEWFKEECMRVDGIGRSKAGALIDNKHADKLQVVEKAKKEAEILLQHRKTEQKKANDQKQVDWQKKFEAEHESIKALYLGKERENKAFGKKGIVEKVELDPQNMRWLVFFDGISEHV